MPLKNTPSAGEAAKFPRFQKLPREIQSMIGVKAAVADPARLAAGIKKLSDVSRPASNYLASDPGLRAAAQRLEQETADLKDHVHDKLYPKDGLPQRELIDGGEPPLYPEELISYTMGRWEHLSDGAKSKLVADILAVSDDRDRGVYVNVIAGNSGKMETVHARPLVASAMEFLEASARIKDYSSFEYAARSFAFLHKHVGDEEFERVEQLLRDPICGEKFEAALKHLEQMEGLRNDYLAERPAGINHGQHLTLLELHQTIEGITGNTSLSARDKNLQVNLKLSGLAAAVRNSSVLEAKALDKHLSAVPDGEKRRVSLARNDLQKAQRPRSGSER